MNIEMLYMLIVFMIAILAVVLSFLLFIRSRKRQLFGNLFFKKNTRDHVIALTFDDGPTEVYTEKVLDILREKGIKATFYFAGNALENNLEIAKRTVNEGHEIGNHSFSHSKMIFTPANIVKDEIDTTNNLIKRAGYTGEITFRPPYGKKFYTLPKYLHALRMKTIMWSLEPEKFSDTSIASNIVDYTVKNTRPGDIILLHPMFESRRTTIEALPHIIQILLDKGYSFLTINELVDY